MRVRAFGSANCRQPAVVLAIATLIVLTFTACGQSATGSSSRGRADAAPGAPHGPNPPVARSQGPGLEATLPQVSAGGGTASALWQRQLVYPAIGGGMVVGLAEAGQEARIEAVSALTGQPRWSVPRVLPVDQACQYSDTSSRVFLMFALPEAPNTMDSIFGCAQTHSIASEAGIAPEA
jgi:hypothetical protein